MAFRTCTSFLWVTLLVLYGCAQAKNNNGPGGLPRVSQAGQYPHSRVPGGGGRPHLPGDANGAYPRYPREPKPQTYHTDYAGRQWQTWGGVQGAASPAGQNSNAGDQENPSDRPIIDRPLDAFGNAEQSVSGALQELARPNFSASAMAPAAFAAQEAQEEAQEDVAEEAFMNFTSYGELPCTPQDYIRVQTECQADNTKNVLYNHLRDCTAAFDVKSHVEPCACSPDDLMWGFHEETDSWGAKKCFKSFLCGTQQVAKVEVDTLHCGNMLPVCQLDMLQTLYRKCDYIRDRKTGQKISEKQAVEVVFYYGHDCDPNAFGAAKAPASAFIPCDTSCGAGKYLHGDKCKVCEAGTFSLGGKVRYDRFEAIDPDIFKTSCSFKRLKPGSKTELETFNCTQGWYAEDHALEVGQFDYVNQWFPDECVADPARDCHNNLEAVIAMDVNLVTDGYVKFNFTVNAEKGHDGLLFYIDTFEEPIMHLMSYQPFPQTVTFGLSSGHHTLYWVYSKDGRFTQGEDIAVVHFIEISGMALNSFKCEPCPAGFYSSEGSFDCLPCPINSFSNEEGLGECMPCAKEDYAVATPRVRCYPKTPCNISADYVKVVSPCKADTRKREVIWKPTLPSTCIDGDPIPEHSEEPCEPCPPGFTEFVDTPFNVIRCKECPPGLARIGSQVECTPCPEGQYPPKVWSFKSYDAGAGRFPSFVSSYCHGACGTSGWRMMTGFIDSGRHHGDGAQLFLVLYMDLEEAGSIWFNYSVDMSAGPKKRGFFFYIDDNIVDFVQDDNQGTITPTAVRESGPWDMDPGKHKIVWQWMRISDDAPEGARDNVIIYDFVVKGSKYGFSDSCEPVPPGYFYHHVAAALKPCPAGTFSPGGLLECTKCSENTFSEEAAEECTPCGSGMTAREGDSECYPGSVNDAASFCTYFDTSNAPSSFENVTKIIEYYFYDLTPLNRESMVRPFGPIHDVGSDFSQSSQYYINICNRDSSNNTCKDLKGNSLHAFACQIPEEAAQMIGHRPAVNLGKRMEIHSLAEEGKGLGGRGLRLKFEGEDCPSTEEPRSLNLTLICSPQSGYGLPSPWTSDGKAAAFDLSLKTPGEWVKRTGDPLPVEDPNSCFHDLVWYSTIACHECSYNDYEEVRVNDCKDNKMFTYRWKEHLACLPTEKAPLPSDILCQPCTAGDFEQLLGSCSDYMGNHNVTYSWIQPKVCSNILPGAVQLPANVLVGPCIQEFFFVPSSILSPKYVFIFALLGVLLVVMLVVYLVAYIKHRRIQRFYTKLVENEEQITEMVDLDDDDELDNGEENHLRS